MPIRIRPLFVRGASLAVLAAVMPLAAQAETASEPSSAFLESVTVTAQKRVQNSIEVPMALTAYSGEFLQKINVQELDKLSLFVPGFEVQNQSPNNPGLVMRGLNLDSGEAAQEPRVSVFEDDVSISTTRATYIELFDIERIEVARGPQTTLFGRSALMGGVNIIQNKASLDKLAAGGSAEFGDSAYRMVDGFVNVPLSDTVAVRAAGRYKARDGYVDNLNDPSHAYNSVNTMAGRLSLTYKPSDAFSAELIGNFEQDRPTGTSFKSGTFLPTNDSGTVLGNLDHTSGAALTDSVAGFENGKTIGLNRRVWDVKGLTTYKIDPAFTLSTVTAYRRFDSREIFDPDGFRQPVLQAAEDERGDQFSHETRLNFDNGGRLSAFAGVSYFYSNVSQRVPMQFNEPMALTLIGGQNTYLQSQPAAFFSSANFTAPMGGATPMGLGTAIISGLAYNSVYNAAYNQYYAGYYNYLVGTYGPAIAAAQAKTMATTPATSYAANFVNTAVAALKPNHWEQSANYGKTKSVDLYADVTYKLLNDLEVEAGVRYTHDDKQTAYAGKTADTSELGILLAMMKGGTAGAGTGILVQPTANNGDKIAHDFSDEGLSWRFTARYAIEDNVSLYATYARGRRPKVLSMTSPTAAYGAPLWTYVAAETIDNYEAGLKLAALDNTLRIDTAVYFYDYPTFQSTKVQNLQFVTFNSGPAQGYGFEGSADWTLTDKIDVFTTWSASRARFLGSSPYKGDQFRLSPDVKFSLGASLRQEFLGGTFNFMPTYTWQSKVYFDDNNDRTDLQTTAAGYLIADKIQDEYQNAYGLLNLRLSYQPDGAQWSASVFASNVLDQKYIKDAGNSGDSLGIPTFIAGEPRFFGASISFKTH